MSYRYSSTLFTCITLLVAGCAMEGTSGSDDTGADPAATQPGRTDLTTDHCVRHVSTGKTSCFDSFTEAIAAATGQQIVDAPADATAAVADAGFRARLNALAAAAPPRGTGAVQPLTTVVVGIEWRDDNFQGPQLLHTADTGCDGDLSTNDFYVAAIADPWNDQISSFQAFSNCEEQLYEAANFGGSQTPLAASLSSVGPAMNDRASSIKWF